MKILVLLIILTPTLLLAQESEQGTLVVRKQVTSNFIEYNDSIAPPVVRIVENMPKFPGGQAALMNYLAVNTVYPDSAKENGITGTVFLSFVVTEDGDISNIKVIRGGNKSFNKEAIRVFEAMPKWNPGSSNGSPVPVTMSMPINFSLK